MIGTIFSGIVIYVCIWWVLFFCMLPLNIQSLINPKDGSMPGAPVNPHLKDKAILATGAACPLWVIAWWVIHSGLISYSAIANNMAM